MRRSIIATLAASLALAGVASAEDWPVRPVSMVVPFAAGGPIDVIARIISPRLGELLGQQIVVENVGGAGGMVGANRVAKAAPDGYTFLFGNQGTHTYSQFLYKKPLYSAVDEFTPVGLVVGNTKVLVTRKDFPADTLAQFIAYAKANQDKMQYGSAGGGSATQIACVLVNDKLGIKVTHVPYRGTALAMQDMMAGRIDYMCDVVSTALPQIRASTVKAIALLSNARSSVLPDLPTAREQGLLGVDADGWNGFFFPRGTPDAVVAKLAAATSAVLDTPSLRERITGLGLDVPPPEQRGPGYLTKWVQIELDKWGPPIKAAGISAD